MASTLKVDQIETPSGVGNISFAQPISGDGSQLTGVGLAVGGGAVVAGDFLYHDGVEWTRLPKGTAAQYLRMNAGATAPEWIATTGAGIPVPAGTPAAGDILYYDGSNYVRLAKGTAAQTLAMNSGATAPEWADAGGGKVLQVIQTHDTTPRSQSLSAATVTNISGLSATITPISATSDIFIQVRWNGESSNTADYWDMLFGLKRDSTEIGSAPGASNRRGGLSIVGGGAYAVGGEVASTPDHVNYEYFDTTRSSGTSAITYYATALPNAACTFVTNRTGGDADYAYVERMTSTITLWEIAT